MQGRLWLAPGSLPLSLSTPPWAAMPASAQRWRLSPPRVVPQAPVCAAPWRIGCPRCQDSLVLLAALPTRGIPHGRTCDRQHVLLSLHFWGWTAIYGSLGDRQTATYGAKTKNCKHSEGQNGPERAKKSPDVRLVSVYQRSDAIGERCIEMIQNKCTHNSRDAPLSHCLIVFIVQ